MLRICNVKRARKRALEFDKCSYLNEGSVLGGHTLATQRARCKLAQAVAPQLSLDGSIMTCEHLTPDTTLDQDLPFSPLASHTSQYNAL
jgi:hypothetical protein